MKINEFKGDGGLVFPVKPKDIWESNGSKLACLDIDNGDAFNFFKKYNFSDVAYVDPPWGQALANQFRGKAGYEQNANFNIFLGNMINILRNVRRDVFIEMGKKWVDNLHEFIHLAEGKIIKTYEITYYKIKLATLTHCTFSGSYTDTSDYTGIDDEDLPFIAIRECTNANDTVLDCCTGRGLSFVASVKNHRKFIGTELSQYRASVSLRKIRDITGKNPTKMIGE